MARSELNLSFSVGQRTVEVRAMDSVGVEDIYENHMKAVLHRYATGEELMLPTPREVKDFLIKSGLVI